MMIQKIFKTTLLAISIIAATAAVIPMHAIILVQTGIGQQYARQIINSIIPGTITWEKLDLSLLQGRVEIRNAVLAGADHRAIARFERLTARISLPSALLGKLDIEYALLEKPVCLLEMDRSGRLNIVKALGIPERKKPRTRPVRLPGFLLVRECILKDGRFGFARPSVGFDLDIQGIRCAAGLNFKDETGRIRLTVGSGFFSIKGRRTDVSSLDLSSAVRNGVAEHLNLKLHTTRSDISLQGKILELFRNPTFDVRAGFILSLAELHDILQAERPFDGTATGAFTAQGTVNNPTIALTASYSGGTIFGSPVGPITAGISMTDRLISAGGIRVYSGTGFCDLQGTIDLRQAYAEGFIKGRREPEKISYLVSATARQFSVRSIPGIIPTARGFIHSDIALSGTGFGLAAARADLSVDTSISQFAIGADSEPAVVTLKSTASISGGVIRVRNFEGLLGRTRFQADGTGDMVTKELHGAFTISSPDIAWEAASMGLPASSGKAHLSGSLSGTTRRPVIIGALKGEAVRIRGIMIGSVSAKASLDETGMASINDCTLSNYESTISFDGGIGLLANDTGEGLPLFLAIKKFEVNPGNFDNRLGGHLSCTGRLEGTTKNPRGSLTLSGTDLDFNVQKFSALYGEARFEERKIWLEPLLITAAPGETIRCTGWIGTNLDYDISLVSDPIALDHIQFIDTSDGFAGNITLDMSGKGSLRNPALKGTIAATGLRHHETSYEDMLVNLGIDNNRFTVKGRLNFDLEGTYLLGKGMFTVSALFHDSDITPYLAAAGRKNLSGRITGKITASGSTAALDRSDLRINLSKFELFNAGERLVHASAFEAMLTNGTYRIPGINLELQHSGWIYVNGSGNIYNSISVNLDANLPLELANRVTNNYTNFSGNVLVKGRIFGTRSHPDMSTVITLNKIGFSIPAIGNDVHNMNGRIEITPDMVFMRAITGSLGTGRFSLSGSMGILGVKPYNIQVNATARSIPIDIPDTLNMSFDANARITGSYAATSVTGDMTILEGTYYKDLVLHPLQDITSITSGRAVPTKDRGTATALDSIHLNAAITTLRPFTVDNNLASLKINSDVRIVGSLNKPLLTGSAWVESGIVHYLGRDFDIVKGKIDFINPYKIEPTITINSNARIQKWLVSIAITGTPDTLKYELSSSPVLDSNNILSLVMLGKTTSGAMTYSPTELLGQVVAFNYGGQIKKTTGIDSLEIKAQDSKGRSPGKGQMVTIGKNIDKRFSIYYSIGRESGETISSSAVKYKLSDSILLDVNHDSKGRFGMDMQYNKEFR